VGPIAGLDAVVRRKIPSHLNLLWRNKYNTNVRSGSAYLCLKRGFIVYIGNPGDTELYSSLHRVSL
jgi:hypothetical protein